MAEVPLGETIEALRAELSAAVEKGANADVQSRHIKIRASALTRSAAVATATSLCGRRRCSSLPLRAQIQLSLFR